MHFTLPYPFWFTSHTFNYVCVSACLFASLFLFLPVCVCVSLPACLHEWCRHAWHFLQQNPFGSVYFSPPPSLPPIGHCKQTHSHSSNQQGLEEEEGRVFMCVGRWWVLCSRLVGCLLWVGGRGQWGFWNSQSVKCVQSTMWRYELVDGQRERHHERTAQLLSFCCTSAPWRAL